MEAIETPILPVPGSRDEGSKARLRRAVPVENNDEDRILDNDDDVRRHNNDDDGDDPRNEARETERHDSAKPEQEAFWSKFSLTHFLIVFLIERLIGFVVRWVWMANGSPNLVSLLELPSMVLGAVLELILLASVIVKMTTKNAATEKKAMQVFYVVTLLKVLLASVLFGVKSWSLTDILNVLSYQSWIFVHYAVGNPQSRFWKLFLVEESVKASLLLICTSDTLFILFDSEPGSSMELVVITAFFFIGTFSMLNLLITLFNTFFIFGIRFKFLLLLASFRLHYLLSDPILDEIVSSFLFP